MQKLLGKSVLITGGTSGVGLATAQLFQEHGARIAVTGRNPASLSEAKKILGTDAQVFASDVSKMADIDTLMDQVAEQFGRLEVLFLNAGIGKMGALEQVTEADFDEQISINLKGVFFTLQKALPLLNSGASVIVTTSTGNRFATPNFSVYAASKAGLRSMVQALALELIGKGVRLNAIAPGPIDTPMYGRGGLAGEALKLKKALIQEKSPCKRLGLPIEVAKAALFLACDDSSYLVGEEIVVDGGTSLLRGV